MAPRVQDLAGRGMSVHPSRFGQATNGTASGGVAHPLPTAPVHLRDGAVDKAWTTPARVSKGTFLLCTKGDISALHLQARSGP